MKNEIFYEETIGRMNGVKQTILSIFFTITGYPRLSLEVFTRKRFGKFYFSMAHAAFFIFIMFPIPYQICSPSDFGWGEFLEKYTTWYVYLIAFGYKSWQHYLEKRMHANELDFSKYSRYSGDPHPFFREFDSFGIKGNPRVIGTILEPGLFLIIANILILFKQPIGYLLLVHSIVYSLGYVAAFHKGDLRLQEIIDKFIVAQELKEISMTGKSPRGDKGFEYFNMPNDSELRQKMAEFLTNRDKPFEAR